VAKIKVKCSECGAGYRVDESHLGKTVSCKQCGDSFVLSQPQEALPASEQRSGVEWHAGDVILGMYEVKNLLGEGGMGKVFRVHHRDWNMDLAVKSPLPHLISNEGAVKNFISEAETWVNLGLYPHTVSCYYVRIIDDIPRVFAECVEGGSLLDWIRGRDGESPKLYEGGQKKALARILDTAIQFAWGLHFAHEKGLIHQDVKPANVMMTPDGAAKVTDFGLANARAAVEEDSVVRADGTVMADYGGRTPAYCSPEQAEIAARRETKNPPNEWPKLTRRTDIWSWAVSILEMFTGEVTWGGGQLVDAAFEMYLEDGPEDGSLPRMPEGLIEVLRKCFKHNPEDRWHNMQQVASKLNEVYGQVAGEEYSRTEPETIKLQGDSLNNRAVSMLDLGRQEEAGKLFGKILKVVPHHIEATFNMAMYEWEHHGITNGEVCRRIEEVCRVHADELRSNHILGKTYLYFGEYSKAVTYLRKAAQIEGEDIETLKTLGLAMCAEAGASEDPALWNNVENCFKKVLQKGYEDQCVVAGYALSLKRQGLGDKANHFYNQAVQKHKNMPLSLDDAFHRFLPGYEVVASRTFSRIKSLAFGQDGQHAFISDINGIAVLYINNEKNLESIQYKVKKGDVNSVATSPDGRFALTKSGDKLLSLWDVKTGRRLRTFANQSGHVISMSISPDGLYALTGSSDRNLRIWDMGTGRCLLTFKGHTMAVNSVGFSPDGKYALSGSSDKSLRLWDIKTGKCRHKFEGHNDRITCVGFSPDGRYALSGSSDKSLRLWDIKTGKCRHKFEGHNDLVTCVGFSPDGRYALSGSSDKSLRKWDVKTGILKDVFVFKTPVKALAITLNSQLILLAHGNTLSLMDVLNQDRYRIPYVLSMPLSTREVEVRSREFLQKLEKAGKHLLDEEYPVALQYISEARAMDGYDGDTEALALWGELLARFPVKKLRSTWERTFKGHRGIINSTAIDPHGRYVLSGYRDKKLRLWDIKAGKPSLTLEGHTDQVTSLAIAKNGMHAVSGGRDKTVRLWDLERGTCIQTFDGHTGSVSAVAISPDGRYALSGGDDRELRLWNLNLGSCIEIFDEHTKSVASVAFGPDGRYAVSGGGDKTVRLWDLEKGSCIQVLEGHREAVTAVAISPDGYYTLSGGDDKTLRLWDLKTGVLRQTFKGHGGGVTTVAFSPDGRFAMSGSKSSTLRLWTVKTGKCIRTFSGHTDGITSVAFGPDGQSAVSAGLDKTLRLWHLDWEPNIRDFVGWSESARPFLEIFLALHTPYSGKGLGRSGKPSWQEDGFQALLKDLSNRGYGWIKPEGVKVRLERMTSQWPGPVAISKSFQKKREKKAYIHIKKALLVPLWLLEKLSESWLFGNAYHAFNTIILMIIIALAVYWQLRGS